MIQFRVLFRFRDLRDVGFRRVIQGAFGEIILFFHLHFHDKGHATVRRGADIEVGFFQQADFRRLIRIQNRQLRNGLISLQIERGIQKADQNRGVLVAAKHFFKGNIAFGIGKMHNLFLLLIRNAAPVNLSSER